jgi:hypothetical protein
MTHDALARRELSSKRRMTGKPRTGACGLLVLATLWVFAVGCNSTCSSSSQCTGGNGCAPGGVNRTCGGPSSCVGNVPCNADSDCADSGVGPFCQPVRCPCGAYAGLCGVACDSPANTIGCPAGHVGQACQGGRCISACATDSDCIANYSCDAVSHTCQAKPCETDSDCNGYCVDKQCASQPGMCVPGSV